MRMVGSRAPGAFLRAGFIALLIAAPQILLGHGTAGARQIVAFCVLIAAVFTFSEYASRAPSLVEFRDARPYNRIRATALAVAVLLACVILQGPGGLSLPDPLRRLVQAWGAALDLPLSPVRILVRTLPPDLDPALADRIRAAVATTYALSLLMLGSFAMAIRRGNWPGRRGFNVWVNLPQFDPTAGGDVVLRLQRDAQVNLALGLLLPVIAPFAADLLSVPFDGRILREPAALVWLVMAWAFVPASLAMRGLALNRLAWLISAHRARLRRAEALAQAA